jgi:protein bicaudal C
VGLFYLQCSDFSLGEMEGVEKARARVRELTPLIFTFDLPIVSSMDVSLDPNDPYLRAIQDQYNIQVCKNPISRG